MREIGHAEHGLAKYTIIQSLIPPGPYRHGSLTVNQVVAGSNPAGGAIKINLGGY